MQTREVTLRDGVKVLLRPLRAEDAALYPHFLANVSHDDLRLRFFAPLRQLSPEMVDKLVHYDPAKAMAFIAIELASDRMLGVVRLHDDDGGASGEFAIIVRTRLKGHGLGWRMMQHMIANAKEKRLKSVRGQVLAENITMLAMCEQLGFLIADDPAERGVKLVTLPLGEVPASATA
jgi:RimJ/RimL family protein N-acetyltransferase